MHNHESAIRFGRCELSVTDRQVFLGGELQALPDPSFELLAVLWRERHRIVSKGELVQAVWGGEPVSDSLLASTVMLARRAIGDTQAQPEWIQSVHSVGYRFTDARSGTTRLFVSAQPEAQHPESTVRLGLLPCVGEGLRAMPEWAELGVPALLAHALWSVPGLSIVTVQALNAALRMPVRTQAAEEHAHRARKAFALDQVLHLSWARSGSSVVLAYSLYGASGSVVAGELRAEDGLALLPALAAAILAALQPGAAPPQPGLPMLSHDPFINQAYARGVQLAAAHRWRAAMQAFEVVRQAEPEAVAALWWQLRCSVALRLPQDLAQGQALLALAEARGDLRTQAETCLLLQRAAAHGQRADERESGRSYGGAALALAARFRLEPWALSLRIRAGLCAAACESWVHARTWLHEAVAQCRVAGQPGLLAQALQSQAQIDLVSGDMAAAEGHLNEALRIQRAVVAPAVLARSVGLMAVVAHELGRAQAAQAHAAEALDMIEALPAPQRPCELLSVLACVHAEHGALPMLQRIQEAFGSVDPDDARSRAHLLAVRACGALSRGDADSARQLLSFAVACLSASAGPAPMGLWLALLSRLESVAGNHSAAHSLMPTQDSWMGMPAGAASRAQTLHVAAARACAEGEPERALELLLGLVEKAPPGRLHGTARLDAAWLHLEAGRADKALALMAAAGAWASQMPAGMAVRARWLQSQGRWAEAADLQKAALQAHAGAVPACHEALLLAYRGGLAPGPDLAVLVSDSWLPRALPQ